MKERKGTTRKIRRNIDVPNKIEVSKSKVGECSRGRPEGSLFYSYYTNV